MTGTDNQIEWAERIKLTVEAEFDRIMRALRRASATQASKDAEDTSTILTILGQLRAEVLAHDDAGYFIRDWQELRDQVRQLLAKDPRYQTIQMERRTRSGGVSHVI